MKDGKCFENAPPRRRDAQAPCSIPKWKRREMRAPLGLTAINLGPQRSYPRSNIFSFDTGQNPG
jgi:hypothetical protein